MAPNGHQGRVIAPPSRTSDVSDAHAATLPDALDETFLRRAIAAPGARSRIGALMTDPSRNPWRQLVTGRQQ